MEDDGTITALRMKVTANIGAYPVFTFIPDLTLSMGVGVYKFTDVDLQSTCVFTNTTTVAAYRGAGRPEAAYYLERLVDIVAAELGQAARRRCAGRTSSRPAPSRTRRRPARTTTPASTTAR